MSRFFTGLGHFAVRFRYLIVVAWVVVTVLAVNVLPSLGDVAKDTTSGFLPADAPSMRAAALSVPFQDTSLAAATLVVSRDGGLSPADNATMDALEARIKAIPKVKIVVDLGVAHDGQARQALIQAEVVAFSAGPEAKGLVDAIRATFDPSATPAIPAGLQVHLTGQLATQIDTVAASGSSQSLTSQLSLLFIVVLLVVAFRALLAPILTLVPAGLVLVLSGPVIAESTKIGVQVSSITELLLVVLILGAGTDYGVFLVFRVREELRRGLSPNDAVIRSVSRVGESITFSALTVIAALVTLVLADFAFYQSLGPALAIGIGLMLLAGLTLLPALLAIFGRAVFWPTGATAHAHEHRGLWDRIGIIATRRPGLTLVAGVALFVVLGATLLTTGVAGFGNASSSPSGTNSAAGSAAIAAHFPSSNTSRSAVLMQFPKSVWDDPSVLAPANAGLAGLSEFGGLVGPLNPNGVPITTEQLVQLHTTLGPARQLPPVPTTTDVPLELYDAYRTIGQLISPDGHIVQFSVEFAHGDSSSPAVLDSVPAMQADVARVAQAAGASASGVFGQVAFASDISHISASDLGRIIPIVAVLIAFLLAIVLRSLVAPLYLVASIVLSYVAALGLVGIIFVHLGGQDGINFILPFLMFVFLLALGSDYNILIMSRIREEAHDLPLRDAVARAVGRTGSTITTAGVILGGTFAVLAVAGGSAGGGQIQQIGYGVAAGILMDTFLLRSLLVPSLVVLLGRWNWWPSHLARATGPHVASRISVRLTRTSIAAAIQEAAGRDTVLAHLVALVGPITHRPGDPDGHFGALVRSIVFQQLAGSAARAIHARVRATVPGEMTPAALLAVPDEALRAAGLSANKLAALRDLSAKVSDGTVDLDKSAKSDEEIIGGLIAVRGIGRWTAEMYLMFELRRLDVWPVDDLGVRQGYGVAWRLDPPPTAKELAPLGDRFRPYRSIVARYCWEAVALFRGGTDPSLR